jgi:soluble lytic murein transglycosylase-like protein
LIEQAAQKYNVSPQLIAAVMLQESGGQADVVSASGAVGLLQVMPSDGIAASFQCSNGPCFASRPSTQQLMDPAFNVDYGVRMLSNLLQKYGSEREALKAYGPYNVGYYYADKVLAIRGNL